MWHNIAALIIKFRIALLILLLVSTGILGYYASQVKISYEFTSAVPTDNPKYIEYQNFRKQFGEDGNLMAIGGRPKSNPIGAIFSRTSLSMTKRKLVWSRTR